jgi:two-component system, NarL family, nitrate/nitrite response regulator NarL
MKCMPEPGHVTLPRGLCVLVGDDFPLIRLAIRDELLERGFCVCAEAGDAPEALAAALTVRPDVCLLDVQMPGGGIAAAAEILTALPETKIVLMASEHCDEDVLASVRVGASGYLVKSLDERRLPHILLDVAAGEVAFPRTLMRSLVDSYRTIRLAPQPV